MSFPARANRSVKGDRADQYRRSSIFGSRMKLSTWSRIINRTSLPVEAGAVECRDLIMEGEETEGEVDQEAVSVVDGDEVGADETTDGDAASASASR